MVDTRFFTSHGPFSLKELASIAGAELHNHGNEEKVITNVASLEQATSDDISFFSNPKYKDALIASRAAACIVPKKAIAYAPKGMALLISDNPYKSYAMVAKSFYPETSDKPSMQSIDPTATIGANCIIEPGVVIGPNAEIGSNCHLEANCVIGKGVVIGEHSHIGSNVTVTHSIVGHHVHIYPGARIGQDGFGFATDKGQHIRVPQLGRVVIGNHVEIGANTTIDRGAGPDTIIGDGCMIDNLVQIGHNVQLGRGCVIVAQVGISGSTQFGDYVVAGGQSGFAGHLKIGSGAQIAAGSGVPKDIPAGEVYGGYPAVPIRQWHRQTAALKKKLKEQV